MNEMQRKKSADYCFSFCKTAFSKFLIFLSGLESMTSSGLPSLRYALT